MAREMEDCWVPQTVAKKERVIMLGSHWALMKLLAKRKDSRSWTAECLDFRLVASRVELMALLTQKAQDSAGSMAGCLA